MANEVDCKEIGVIIMAKVAMQSCYLTGTANKHHLTTLFQELLRLTVSILYAALQILAAHHKIDALDGLCIDMMHFPCLIVDSSEDYATFLDDLSCQGKEHASRTAVHALQLVAVLCRENGEGRYLVLRTENGANLLAQSTLDADAFVYLGIEKSLAVLTQGDAMLGTTLETCSTTTASAPPTTISLMNLLMLTGYFYILMFILKVEIGILSHHVLPLSVYLAYDAFGVFVVEHGSVSCIPQSEIEDATCILMRLGIGFVDGVNFLYGLISKIYILTGRDAGKLYYASEVVGAEGNGFVAGEHEAVFLHVATELEPVVCFVIMVVCRTIVVEFSERATFLLVLVDEHGDAALAVLGVALESVEAPTHHLVVASHDDCSLADDG